MPVFLKHCVCEVGTVNVGKISNYQLEGSAFWLRVEVWATFFCHTFCGERGLAVGLVSCCCIGGLKRTLDILVDQSWPMTVLSTVSPISEV